MFVITGPPGSGKTTLLEHLVGFGFQVVPEPAREVLAEQRANGVEAIYDSDPVLFNELMLARAIADFERMSGAPGPVFFDRGIPDMIGYAELFGLDTSAAERAARTYRYDSVVFALPSWREIYVTDGDRRMTAEAAEAFGARVREVYEHLDYTVVDVPRDTVAARASFVVKALRERDVLRPPDFDMDEHGNVHDLDGVEL